MIEPAMSDEYQPSAPLPLLRRLFRPVRRDAPIVPRNSISRRALVVVVAIMTFLASLTTGAVMIVLGAAADWQSEVSRELTIQVRPVAGRDFEAEVKKAVDIARAVPGIAEVRPYSKEESAKLLEPWLGSGLSLDSLPVPRLVVVRVAPDERPDLDALRATLAAQVAGASLDDHSAWVDRMRTMADTALAAGVAVVAMVLAVTVLSVSFATRGAMATNRPVVEVLHVIGARDRYIAGQFQRHFLVLGLEGGVIGGGAALALFVLAGLLGDRLLGSVTTEEVLFGTFMIGAAGYAALSGQIVLIAVVTAWTSRRVVNHTLKTID